MEEWLNPLSRPPGTLRPGAGEAGEALDVWVIPCLSRLPGQCQNFAASFFVFLLNSHFQFG